MHRSSLSRPPRVHPSQPGRLELRGRLVHDDDDATPLHGARVEVFFAHGSREDLLARCVSDANGRFALQLQLPPRFSGGSARVRVLELRAPLEVREALQSRWRVAARASSAPLFSAEPVDLGTIRVRWWEWRASPPPRLAPDPVELAEGRGPPLADRPVPPLWDRRVARLAAPPDVDGPTLPIGALLSAVWTGPAGADGSCQLADPLGEEADPGVVLRRCALVRWLAAGLRLEQAAVAAHRHLRGPSAPWLLPLLRGAAWTNAVAEHHLLAGALDEVLGVPAARLLPVVARASAQLTPGQAGDRPAGWAWRRVWESLTPALAQEVDRWLATAEGVAEDPGWRRFVAELRPRGRALPSGDPLAPVRAAMAEVLELAVIDTAWWRAWLLHDAARPGGALRSNEPPHVAQARRRLASGLMLSGDLDPFGELDGLPARIAAAAPAMPVEIAWPCRAAL